MSLSTLPLDQQINILINLPPIDLLNACQTNHHLHSLCQNHPRLNQYFQELTKSYLGVNRLYGNNWYQTVLTIYNDLRKTADRLILLIPLKIRKYINLNEIRTELIDHLRLALFSEDSFHDTVSTIADDFFMVDNEIWSGFIGRNYDGEMSHCNSEIEHRIKVMIDYVLGKYIYDAESE